MYDVVINVSDYKYFVPFCCDSFVQPVNEKLILATLSVDFKLAQATYTSKVTFEKPNFVNVNADNQSIFQHLHNKWEFAPGPLPNSCYLTFNVSFKFSNKLFQHFAKQFLQTSKFV
jgi:ribosome-associated toxin RatA of RatAB toxin-antitoxin module